MKGNRIIWSANVDFEDWREDLTSEYPDLSEDELHEIMYDLNDVLMGETA